jgi:hypothetical protein
MPPNRLINEKSPYLLQHAHNPVDWHAWKDETFAKAAEGNKPIFLSIGYATCHWCHVMEKESFEDEEAARYLNETFVCIKVDREERPDVDAVYMAACQMMTGSGGWPLNICMTPDKKPFFAATYLPRRSRFERLGLIELCQRVKSLWALEPHKVVASAAGITNTLGKAFEFGSADAPGLRLLDRAYDDIAFSFDGRFGGFEPAPKFPTPHRLLFLLRCHDRTAEPRALEMVERTLTAMRLGGIWDHVGFGFHRYSTDAHWLLPHFEKMLYDQALIALACLEAFQVTGTPLLSQTANEIFTYVLRDMTAPQGAFYSAEDADSEGIEGKFYVWSQAEFRQVLGAQEALFWEPVFNLKPEGNFREEAGGHTTGANILHLSRPFSRWVRDLDQAEEDLQRRWEAARGRLFAARAGRVHPLKDDKILADWNGLMIAALAEAAMAFERPEWLELAARAFRFIRAIMMRDGRLFHAWRANKLQHAATLDDHAHLASAALALHEATGERRYLDAAQELAALLDAHFWDRESGGYFMTADDVTDVIQRPKSAGDNATPNGNGAMVGVLVRLYHLTGEDRYLDRTHALVAAFSGELGRNFFPLATLINSNDFLENALQIVVVGPRDAAATRDLVRAVHDRSLPNRLLQVVAPDAQLPERHPAAGKGMVGGKPAAYVCRGQTCGLPVTHPQGLGTALALG